MHQKSQVSIPSLVGRLLGRGVFFEKEERWKSLNTLAGGQAPRTWSRGLQCSLSLVSIPSLVGRLLGLMGEIENLVVRVTSQYPRWWAGSSDMASKERRAEAQRSLNTLAGGQAPRTVCCTSQRYMKDTSQYPRWWAGSSDATKEKSQPLDRCVSIPSLVGRLLGP